MSNLRLTSASLLAMAGAKVFYNGAFLGVALDDVVVIPEEQAQKDMAREFREQPRVIDRETKQKRRWLAEELRK